MKAIWLGATIGAVLMTGGMIATRPAAAQSGAFRECLAAIDTDALTSSQRLVCATREMRSSDRELNATYQRALRRLRPDQRHGLREQERAWIAHRRETCALERQEANPSQDYNRMLCLIRETDAQTARLRSGG